MSLEIPKSSSIAQVPSRHHRERKRGNSGASSGLGGNGNMSNGGGINAKGGGGEVELSSREVLSPQSIEESKIVTGGIPNGASNLLSPSSTYSGHSPSPKSQDSIYFRRETSGSKLSGSVIASRRSKMKRDSLVSGASTSSSRRGDHKNTSSTGTRKSDVDERNLTMRSSHSQNPMAWYNPAVTHSLRDSIAKDATLKSVKERPSNIERPKKPASRHSLLAESDIPTPKAGHGAKPEATVNPPEDDSPHSDGSSHSNSSGGSPNLEHQSSSARLPRPGALSSKARPTSHKKKARSKPPVPLPPETDPKIENEPPVPQVRKGALGSKSKSQYKKNEASKSFLGSSFLNLSFLLPKTNSSANLPPPTIEIPQKASELKRTNSSIPVDKYPTNENSLARMTSYAALPTTNSFNSPGAISNTHLHPAAAGMDTNKLIRHSSVLQLGKMKQKSVVNEQEQHAPENDIITTERRDFSRFYHQDSSSASNNFSEESDFFRIANFALDCGPSLEQKILSHKHATHVASFLNPGMVDEDGNLVQHPLNSDFGWFEYPFKNIFRRQKATESGVLERYGIGISIWFKFLKSFCVIFFVMFLLTSPSLIVFIRGSWSTSEQRNFEITTSPSDMLFMTTLGNLGTTQNLCFTVQPDDKVTLECQGSIVAISAYYGHPNGSCTCPVPQQPTIAGECPGRIQNNGCSKDLYGNEEACYYSRYDMGYGDPQPCCAYRKAGGEPSLDELQIRANYDCNSLTAQYIAEGMCLGKSSCTLTASDTHLYSWRGEYAKNLPSNVCKSSVKSKNNIMLNECNTTLTHLGSWAECPLGEDSSTRFLQVQAICSPDRIGDSDTSLSKATVVIIASVLNALAVLVFTFGVYWVAIQQKNEESLMDRNTCRAKDFTVCISHIPAVYSSTQDLAKKLKRHFEKVLSASRPCFLPGAVRVVDINFTTGSYSVLQTAINRGNAARELDAINYKKTILEYLGNQHTWWYKFLQWREKEWNKKYQYWNDKCLRGNTDASKHVKRAYITFESEEGVKRCLRVFSSNSLNHYFDDPEYLLEGKEILTSPAEDPSDILWENLGTPRLERSLRRLLTNILLFALILFTYLAVDAATTSHREFQSGYPVQINCADYKVDLNRSNIDNSIESLITYDRVLHDVEWQYYNNSFGRQGYLNCYCREVYLVDGLGRMLKYKFENPSDHKEEYWCKRIAYGFVKVTVLRMIVALVVVAVNVGAKSILRGLKDFEKRSSHSAISTSMTFKLFLVQVVNAGLLILLMNGYIRDFNDDSSIAFLNGKYADFTISWYSDVGKSLIGTMILYMFGVHGLKFAIMIYMKFRRWQDTHFTGDPRLTYQVSQEQLNRLYIGTEFVIEVRYATVLTICFVCVSYASAMPIMYLVAAVAFFIHYWIDKYFFLRVNRIPRAVSPTLALHVTRTFYLAGFLNLCVAIWAFSNVDVFDPAVDVHKTIVSHNGLNFVDVKIHYLHYTSFYERIFNQYTIASWLGLAPLILGVVAFASLALVKTYGHHFNFCIRYFSHLLQHESTYEGNPEYFDSIPLYLLRRRVEDGIVKKHILERYKQRIKELENNPQKPGKQLEGLESYDIGLNEIYADKFALNSDFILKHRPRDLFRGENCECKDEETGLLQGITRGQSNDFSPQSRSSPTRQSYLPFSSSKSPRKSPRTVQSTPRTEPAHSPRSEQHLSPRGGDDEPTPRATRSSAPRASPTKVIPTPPARGNRPHLESVPSACSILNDDVVAEIKDVAELF